MHITIEKVAAIYLDIEKAKNDSRKFIKIFCYVGDIDCGHCFRFCAAFPISRYRMDLEKESIMGF